jgi:hypothetical protein
MSLPKPTEYNIELSNNDLKGTDEMEVLTQEISKKIQNKEDEISRFYKFFNSFEQWVKLNNQSIQNIDHFKNLIFERLKTLSEHIQTTTEFLENLKILTKSEEKIDSQKIMSKNDVSNDFNQESIFAKNLKYPHKIIHLAKDISNKLQKAKGEIATDLTIEKKTEELINNILLMLSKISQKLNDFNSFVSVTQDFSSIDAKIDELVMGIQVEKGAFEKLSKFEKIHLNLLLELKSEEEKTLKEENEFKQQEDKLK